MPPQLHKAYSEFLFLSSCVTQVLGSLLTDPPLPCLSCCVLSQRLLMSCTAIVLQSGLALFCAHFSSVKSLLFEAPFPSSGVILSCEGSTLDLCLSIILLVFKLAQFVIGAQNSRLSFFFQHFADLFWRSSCSPIFVHLQVIFLFWVLVEFKNKNYVPGHSSICIDLIQDIQAFGLRVYIFHQFRKVLRHHLLDSGLLCLPLLDMCQTAPVPHSLSCIFVPLYLFPAFF